jgi:hypothetical protein
MWIIFLFVNYCFNFKGNILSNTIKKSSFIYKCRQNIKKK